MTNKPLLLTLLLLIVVIIYLLITFQLSAIECLELHTAQYEIVN